jgi:Mg2+-importing ATPase
MDPQPSRTGKREMPRLQAKRVVIGVAITVALVAGVVGLIGHVAEFSRIRDALDRVELMWLLPAVGGRIAGYAGYVMAYRDVAAMRRGPILSAWTATRIVALGFGALVAASAAGAIGVHWWALHRAGCAGRSALRRVLGFNTLQWLTLGTFAAVAGLVAVLFDTVDVPTGMALGWMCVVPVCVAAGSWVSSPTRIDRFTQVPDVARTVRATPRALAHWAYTGLRIVLADAIGGLLYVREAVAHPTRHRAAVAGYVIYWTGDLLTLYSCAQAFGESLALVALVLAYATGYVATALPLPVGGAGGVDAAITLTLTAVGLPLAHALLIAVTYRGVSFWLPIIPALALLPTAPQLTRDLDELAGRSRA